MSRTPSTSGRSPAARSAPPFISADSRLPAVGKQDAAIHLWDLQANRELPPLAGAHGPILALVFTADGKELVAVDTEGMRLSWRMAALRRNTNIRLAPLDDADFA